MPTYGRRRFVAQAVRYFLAQDFPDRELVVVDDGPDPVADLLPTGDAVRYLRVERRMTIGAKRNLACSLASGDVLIQWDDDDWYGPDRIRLQVDDLLAGRADITFLPQAWILDLRTTEFWCTDQPVGAGATFAFTREMWSRTEGYEDASAGEDWGFFHRVLRQGGRSRPVEETGSYVYVRHATNAYRLDFDRGSGPGEAWRRADAPSFLPPDDAAFYRSLRARPPRPEPEPEAAATVRPAFRAAAGRRVPLAFVHHANQHLVTDGYADREGITELAAAYRSVLDLHARHRVPFHLHLSGTLVEALAWHRPDLLARVRALREEGLVELLGSTYAQNVMTVSSPAHNRRQLDEALALYDRHLGGDLGAIRGFWVPERIWDTERLAPLLTDPGLANGGYRYVVLDDRLALAAGDRPAFDATAPGAGGPPPTSPPPGAGAAGPTAEAFAIEGGRGLVMVPLSAHLRWLVPPRQGSDWDGVEAVLRSVGGAGDRPAPRSLAVYADDLEKTASAGPWGRGPWGPDRPAGYGRLLEWVARSDVEPVLLSGRLAPGTPGAARPVAPGTYYELAHAMGAGEDYRRWWDDARWAPYRRRLDDAEALLERGLAGPAPLGELAWKQLMACSYEEGWQVPGRGGAYRPAPWIRATAAHAAGVAVVAEAARRASTPTGGATARLVDLDGDGHDEVVLANDQLLAVIGPRCGGRLLWLFDLARGALVVGTPADDWHLQEDLATSPDAPRNHLGALADHGREN
ncbi:MAG TPA: glycosyltransferase, partial [Acidimicrobiales bacterium]|nr:glycosyltransferase [Acidimicrobiales bacterium]